METTPPSPALSKLRALHQQATPGPWHRFHDKDGERDESHRCHCGQIWSDQDLLFIPSRSMDDEPVERAEDGRLIVALRNQASALLALWEAAHWVMKAYEIENDDSDVAQTFCDALAALEKGA